MSTIKIYTDGSCDTTLKTGGWAAIIFFDDKKIIFKGIEFNTTHNRMELTAVIKSLQFIEKQKYSQINVNVYSDSQYVIKIPERISNHVWSGCPTTPAQHFLKSKGRFGVCIIGINLIPRIRSKGTCCPFPNVANHLA